MVSEKMHLISKKDHDITIEYDVTQRTVRFIRWLRAHIYSEAHLGVSAARLARVWGC